MVGRRKKKNEKETLENTNIWEVLSDLPSHDTFVLGGCDGGECAVVI